MIQKHTDTWEVEGNSDPSPRIAQIVAILLLRQYFLEDIYDPSSR